MGFIVKAVKSVIKTIVHVIGGVAGLLLGGIFKKGNAKNSATGNRLSKRLEPEDFRKIVFGETAFDCSLRYWEVHGSKFDRYSEVIAAAAHTVESFGAFYIEDELVPFTGANATGTFAGALSRLTNTGAPGASALAVGSGSYWTTTSKFTGVAHYALAWTVDSKKLPNGVPSRYTQVGKGARVYDPRKDSTRGGSGTHRADDQSTWAYATVDSNGQPIGRNNALQMIWYLLGWRVQNPSTLEWTLVAGRGVDPADVNWTDMIAAANDAEALQYYTDMILSTGDEHEQNESIISADGLIGELLDPGGLWTYKITKDDTADVAVDLGEDDVLLGDVSWTPKASLSEQFNEIAGTFIDPSVTSLYQAKAYPAVKDASYATADGFKKRATHNFQCVQDATLAQKLARVKLNRSRFTGEFKATFGFRALKAQVWSIVRLTIDRYAMSTKLFRVMSQSITDQGIEMVLREESALIYAAGSVTSPAAPSSMVKYDIRQQVAVDTFAVAQVVATGADGTVFDGIRASWVLPAYNVRRTEVEYQLNGATAWFSAGMVGNDGTSLNIDIVPVLSNTLYNVRARTWSIHEVAGAWSTSSITTGSAARLYVTQLVGADGVLSTIEKVDTNREWNDLTNEKAGIDARATALGITTEKTTYDNAYSTLSTYLGTISPAFTTLTASSPVTRATWNTNWSALYTARQALLNKIDAVSATLANWSGVVNDNGGLPSNNAGTSGILTAIGTFTIVTGNSLYKTGGTHGAFQGGAVGQALYGTAFISSSIYAPVSGGGYETHLALDNDATAFAASSMNYELVITTFLGFTWDLRVANGSVASGSGSGQTAASRAALAYDGAYVYAFMDGVLLARTAVAAGQTLYPKFLDYYNTAATGSSPGPIKDILYGPFYSDATVSQIVPTKALDQVVYYDYTGTAKAGELTRALTNYLKKGAVDISSSATWAFTPSGCTVTAGSNGVVTLNTVTAINASILVTATYAGKNYTWTIMIARVQDDPPSGGTTATSFLGGVSGTPNSTVYTTPVVIASGTMLSNGSGQVRLSATVEYQAAAGVSASINGKWQRSPAGTNTWTDTGISGTGTTSVGPAGGLDDFGTTGSFTTGGSMATGMSNNTAYDFRLIAVYVTASMSVTGSVAGAQS